MAGRGGGEAETTKAVKYEILLLRKYK